MYYRNLLNDLHEGREEMPSHQKVKRKKKDSHCKLHNRSPLQPRTKRNVKNDRSYTTEKKPKLWDKKTAWEFNSHFTNRNIHITLKRHLEIGHWSPDLPQFRILQGKKTHSDRINIPSSHRSIPGPDTIPITPHNYWLAQDALSPFNTTTENYLPATHQ